MKGNQRATQTRITEWLIGRWKHELSPLRENAPSPWRCALRRVRRVSCSVYRRQQNDNNINERNEKWAKYSRPTHSSPRLLFRPRTHIDAIYSERVFWIFRASSTTSLNNAHINSVGFEDFRPPMFVSSTNASLPPPHVIRSHLCASCICIVNILCGNKNARLDISPRYSRTKTHVAARECARAPHQRFILHHLQFTILHTISRMRNVARGRRARAPWMRSHRII